MHMEIYNLKQHNVIIYGIGNTLKDSIDYIEKRYNIIGLSDSDLKKSENVFCDKYKFYSPDKIPKDKIDYILINSVYEDEICDYLINDLNILSDIILKRDIWQKMLFKERFGDKNPNITFYVLSRPIRVRNGLMANLYCFLEQLQIVENNNYVPVVDMKNYPNQYLAIDDVGKINSWEYYYEQLSDYSLDEVYQSRNVILGYDCFNYLEDFEKVYDIDELSRLYKKYIKVNTDMEIYFDKTYDELFSKGKKILGVLYRGTDMVALKLKKHAIQPTVQQMIDKIHEILDQEKYDYIYVCTEDKNALERIELEFGDCIKYVNQYRYEITDNTWLADITVDRENDRFLRGRDYLTAMLILSKCDRMVAGLCSGSICSLIMNNKKYKKYEFLEYGIYK